MPRRRPPRGPVPQDAVDYLEAKVGTPAFSYLDVWREEHDSAFTVAKIMENDILRDVQDSLAKSLEEGTTFRKWAKEIKPLLDRSGWSAYGTDRQLPARLDTIYDTNMRQARAVGQWQRIERTKAARPFLRYALGPSERHRPEHASWDGTVLPVDDPWWVDHFPPGGWRCKCVVSQESRAVTERRGGTTPRPPSPDVDWTNPRTGRKLKVPLGIDPGFDYRPTSNARRQSLNDLENQSEAQRKTSRSKL